MPKATIFIQSANEPNVILVHVGTLRFVRENGKETVFVFKYKNGRSFISVVLPHGAKYRIENGVHTARKLYDSSFGQFMKHDENQDFVF